MAGFWIVVMALGFVLILLIIYGIFELLTILSIIFSAVSLTKSKKYVALNGNYSFKSVKRFHNASVVFFVFGCIGFSIIGFALIAYITEMEGPMGGEAFFYVFQLAKYIAFFALGIKSFMKFPAALALNRSLYAAYAAAYGQYPNNGYNRYPNQQQGYYQGQYQQGNYPQQGNSQQSGFPQQNGYNPTPNSINGQPNYSGQPNGFTSAQPAPNSVSAPIPIVVTDPVKQEQIASDASAPTFSTYENNSEELSSTAEKRCPKCGAVNDNNFKFCISCGEKL